MGSYCCSPRNKKTKSITSLSSNINNTNNKEENKNNLLQKKNNSTENIKGSKVPSTSAASVYKIVPEIYEIRKFGIDLKPRTKITHPLKFIFHFHDFKCKHLIEDTIYILRIIFDGKEYPLSFGNGKNPNFIFDETIGKEITFEKMENSYFEVYLYTHKSKSTNMQFYKEKTMTEILNEAQIFACFKINLLTVALAPKNHDLELVDPRRNGNNRVVLGRINYCASCRQVENISIKVKSFKIDLKELNYNEIALNLKYENASLGWFKESEYTENLIGKPNTTDNVMTYQYSNIDEGIISLNNKNNLNDSSLLLDEINSNLNEKNKKSSINSNSGNSNYSKQNHKLLLSGKMCMNDLFSSEITLNIFSVRLQEKKENKKENGKQNTIIKTNNYKTNKNKSDNSLIDLSEDIDENEIHNAATFKKDNNFLAEIIETNEFNEKEELPEEKKHIKNNKTDLINRLSTNKKINKSFLMEFKSRSAKKHKTTRLIPSTKKLLILENAYTLIGVISLNFYKILYEHEDKIVRETSKFFQSMSNVKNALNKTLSGSKINVNGFEETLQNKSPTNNNLKKHNDEEQKIQHLTCNIIDNVNQYFVEKIYWKGEAIGTINVNLEISNLPLMKQIMFGVMTETGFEINSIFLYDNLNLSNDLPEELLELIKIKERFEQEISTNINQNDFDKNISNILLLMKKYLSKSIDDSCLYYGYSSNKDLFQGQNVLLDLGINCFDLIDKLNFDHRKKVLDIIKLILQRSEFDLGTVSVSWFKTCHIVKAKRVSCENTNNKKRIDTINNIDTDSDKFNKSNNSLQKTKSAFLLEECEYEFKDKYLIENHVIEKFLKLYTNALNFCLDNLVKGKNIDTESHEFTNYFLSLAYFRIPLYREAFINTIYSKIDVKNPKYVKFAYHNLQKTTPVDYMHFGVSSNLMFWDDLFYKKLDSALNRFLLMYKSQSPENKNLNKYLEDINAIKEQLMDLKYITSSEDNQKNYNYYQTSVNKYHWSNKVNKRDFIFYDLVLELLKFIYSMWNKVNTRNFHDRSMSMKKRRSIIYTPIRFNVNLMDIPGIEKLIEVINYDLIMKDVKLYPKQIHEIIPMLYSDISIINNCIDYMIRSTNIYDTQSIFNLVDILDSLFNKDLKYKNFHKYEIRDGINYHIIQKSFFVIINSDNSLAIAKYIWFYYKNITKLNYKHVNEVITYIIIPFFFKFFFHWSFQIRNIFYHFIIYIIKYRLKSKIKDKKFSNSDDSTKSLFFVSKRLSMNIFENLLKNNEDENDKQEEDDEEIYKKKAEMNQFYYFGEYFNEKMKIVKNLQKIIEKEKYNVDFMEKIDTKKYRKDIEVIPEEYHENITIGIFQYNKVVEEFNDWLKNINEKKIQEKDIEYPKIDIVMIKDDTIQYELEI